VNRVRTTLLPVNMGLLRQAGEHLGALAEEARYRRDLTNGRRAQEWAEACSRLLRLSKELLEVADEAQS
jgi:hypothetical protein